MYSFLRLSLIATIAFLLFRQIDRACRRRVPLPPGPKGLPILGNARDIATRQDLLWITYYKWAQHFGDIFHVKVFGNHTVVLNSHEAVTELLEKRSQNYSDRPDMPMLVDVMIGGGWQIAFMRYSESWRLHRKTFHQPFQGRNLLGYYDIQRNAATDLLEKLASSPEGFFDHISYFAGSTILKIIYGYTLKTKDDPYRIMVDKAHKAVIPAMNHGSFWVDYLPILKHVPDFIFVEAAGVASTSFCTQTAGRLGVTIGEGSEAEDMIKNCAYSAYTAATETSASALLTFILAMTLYPEVQVRAQKEIKSVVSPGGVPDFNDRDNLPYINAIIAEVLRWHPVTPLALPHRAVDDDIYAGYYIPADTAVVPNVWAIMHDKALYGPDVDSFNPDRFLKSDGQNPPNPEQYAFGFGRRVCLGKGLGVNSLYLAISNILASYTIAKPLDDSGNEFDPKVEYAEGGISLPKPFKCRFIPRSPVKGVVVA